MYLQKVFIFLGYFISCRNFSKNQHFGGHQPNSTQNNQNIFTFYTTLIIYNLIPKILYRGRLCLLKKLGKPVCRPMGRQLNKFRSMLCTLMKTNCCNSLGCLPFGLQSCFQEIWSFPLFKISMPKYCFLSSEKWKDS